MNTRAYLYFHQGWTDIINQLALISYYASQYEKICLIIRHDAQPVVDFYVRPLKNVEVIYSPLEGINDCSFDHRIFNDPETDILCHGLHDRFRPNFTYVDTPDFFVRKFYERYNIDYQVRVNSFEIQRDPILENQRYQEFVINNGHDYVLVHEDPPRGITLNIEPQNYPVINLDKKSAVFFDYIKILENAKQIYVMDSVWATIIYHLDAKYGLFQHIPIEVKCLRGYQPMFQEPVKLNNWTIK